MTFSKLVRIRVGQANTYGDLLESNEDGYLVQQLDGSIEEGFKVKSAEPVLVKTLLCPLERTPMIYCIGLNYHKHAEFMKQKIPRDPPVFAKPADALAGPFQPVHIHPDLQEKLDYEAELTVVIGRDAKNVLEADALDYLLGYTMGNDVSARDYQKPENCGYQVGYAKSFDEFGPIGPAILAPKHVADPQKLHYYTRVNGEIKQDVQTADMIFTVRQIIAHLSRGRTLRVGTVIMTGTSIGLGLDTGIFLKDGDVVEIELDGLLPPLANKMVFEKAL